eukprot:gene11935-13171_t
MAHWIMLCALLSPFLGLVFGQQGEKMTFEMPKLSEEEQHSQHIPANLACDACTAVAFQMTKMLEKEEAKRHGKKLKESEYLDLFEKHCYGKTFDEYGLKTVNGENRLSGDGLEGKEVPGMLQGGGKWPGRLVEKCATLIGEIGEDEVYGEFRSKGNLFNLFCEVETKDCIKKSGKQEL